MAVHRFSVKQPAVPAQHHVLLGGHLEDLCIQDSVRRDQLLPEGEVVRNIVGSVLTSAGGGDSCWLAAADCSGTASMPTEGTMQTVRKAPIANLAFVFASIAITA